MVTPSGGACEIIADRAEDEGVALPEFSERTLTELRELCPPFATVQNPLDVTGYVLVDPNLLRGALEVVAADPGVDVTLLLSDLPRQRPVSEAAEALVHGRVSALADTVARTTAKTGRPIIVMSTALSEITEYGRELTEQTDYPHVLGGIEHGLTALGHALAWSARYRRTTAAPPAPARVAAAPADPARDPLELVAGAAATRAGAGGATVAWR